SGWDCVRAPCGASSSARAVNASKRGTMRVLYTIAVFWLTPMWSLDNLKLNIMKKLILALFIAAAAWAQSPKKEIPRLADGKPDLNGVWDIPYTPDMSRGVPGGLPFTPWGEQEWKSYDPTQFDSTGHCLPPGLTRLVN